MLTSDPALPPKPLGTRNCIETLPHKDRFTDSPNFIETEKVNQNEKTEEFVSNERKRKKITEKTIMKERYTIYQIKSSKH